MGALTAAAVNKRALKKKATAIFFKEGAVISSKLLKMVIALFCTYVES